MLVAELIEEEDDGLLVRLRNLRGLFDKTEARLEPGSVNLYNIVFMTAVKVKMQTTREKQDEAILLILPTSQKSGY